LEGDVDNSWNIVTKGGTPTCQNIDYVPETASVYVTVRGNQAFLPIGSVETANPGGFSNLLARFDLPSGFSTGIGEISAIPNDDVIIVAKRGELEILNKTDKTKTLAVFDMTGRKVAVITVNGGCSKILELNSGVYIVNGRKVVI
ncbi:MAG: T9SS type A sorting domain-containing protein, partial [Muribaculaceae bacterium]|nr:T9SS type A sorting domain-containing protein [Muribaculaceae bacterium]